MLRRPASYEPSERYWKNIAGLDQRLRERAEQRELVDRRAYGTFTKAEMTWETGYPAEAQTTWKHSRLHLIGRLAIMRGATTSLEVRTKPTDSIPNAGDPMAIRKLWLDYYPPFGRLHETLAVRELDPGSHELTQPPWPSPTEADYTFLLDQLRRGASGEYDIMPQQ